MRRLLIIAILSSVKLVLFAQSRLHIYDATTNQKIDNVLIYSISKEAHKYYTSGDTIDIQTWGRWIDISHLSYMDRKVDLSSYVDDDTIRLTPIYNTISQVDFHSKPLNIYDQVSQYLRSRKPKKYYKSAITVYSSYVEGTLIEHGKISSIDQISNKDYKLISREAIDYKYDTNSPFFNLDIDKSIRLAISKNAPVKNLLNLKEIKSNVHQFRIIQCIVVSGEEVCDISYLNSNSGTRGFIKFNIDSNEILHHKFTIYNWSVINSLNQELPFLFDSLTISASIDENDIYNKVKFEANYSSSQKNSDNIGLVKTQGVIQYFNEKINPGFKVVVPEVNVNSIQEDLNFTLSRNVKTINSPLNANATNILISNDLITRDLLEYFDFGMQVIHWSKNEFLDASAVSVATDLHDIPHGEFPMSYINFNVYWSFYIDVTNNIVLDQSSIWDKRAARLVGSTRANVTILSNIILDNMEACRIKLVNQIKQKLASNKGISTTDLKAMIQKSHSKALEQSRGIIAKSKYGNDLEYMKTKFETLNNTLKTDKSYIEFFIRNIESFDHTYADLLLASGYTSQAISEYISTLDRSYDNATKSVICYNLAVAYKSQNDIHNLKKYLSLAIKFNPKIIIDKQFMRFLE